MGAGWRGSMERIKREISVIHSIIKMHFLKRKEKYYAEGKKIYLTIDINY